VTFGHAIGFEVAVAVAPAVAIAFVRDVSRSLAHAHFLHDLQIEAGPPVVVAAALPINAALFGQRDLPFRSVLTPTEQGACLDGLDVSAAGPGWASVSGSARVDAADGGSLVRYDLTITVYVALPESDHWGARALVRMIEYAAATVLSRIATAFPAAVARAAQEVERGTDRDAAWHTAAASAG
jgi:hypothetical protein